MCNEACIRFGLQVLKPEDIQGRRVLEVGSLNVNGSLRSNLSAMDPSLYLGIDLEPGPGVDEICDATDIVSRYGEGAWDAVVCTELLEHVWNWRAVASNLKRSLRTGGKLVVTTRSMGFAYHAYPFDFWRFEPSDALAIFGDLDLLRVEKDPEMPGIFVSGVKPKEFAERDLGSLFVYSVLKNGPASDPEESILKDYTVKLRAERERVVSLEASHRQLLASLSQRDHGERSEQGAT